MRPLCDDPSLPQDDDVVRPPDLRQPVCDEQGRPAFGRRPDGLLDVVLCRAVDGARAVVQNQDARVGQEGPRNCQPLALPLWGRML